MILNLLVVVLGIAAIVGIHEAAHMFVSKLFGVKVLKFSLGFGPVLFSKKIGDTQYQLSALPLGGYVQCSGEDPETNVEGGFFSLPWYKRALIALAGPAANLILGFLLIYGLLVAFKGWPLIWAAWKAYALSKYIIVSTIQWIFGTLPATPHAGAASSGLAGPIMVTRILMSSIREGAAQFLFILSLISLSLGLFNLFPVPGLDGGHVFLYLLEGFRGKKFSSKVYIVWAYLGFLLLGSFMLYMCISDIINLMR